MCDMSTQGPQLSTVRPAEEGGRVVDAYAKVEAVFGLRNQGAGEPETACEGVFVSGLSLIDRCESCGRVDRLIGVDLLGDVFRVCPECSMIDPEETP